jgi:pimeloyl-ACP methyl ester carboxylesterase
MPKIEVRDGFELAYEELGSGDRYVLSLMMDFPPVCMPRELAKAGYHVFLITNRGIGQSTHVFEDYGDDWFDIFADDVAAFADKMGIDKFVYCGCSHGAGTGWHLVLRHPERVTAFIAMVGGPHNLDEGQWSYRSMAAKGIKMKPMDPPTDDEAINRRAAFNVPYYTALRAAETPEEKAVNYRRPLVKLGTEAKVQEALRTIQTPTLMLGGLEDPISRPDLMLRTAQCLPHGKLVLYSGFGHSGPFSRIVEEAAEEALNFLRNVEKTGRVYKEVLQD